MSRALTRLGLNRERYSAEVKPAPPRFDGTSAYVEWAARADANRIQEPIHSMPGGADHE